jgi:hypothetical protein
MLKWTIKWCADRVSGLLSAIAPKLVWRLAQQWEFLFHRKDGWRHTPDFMAHTARLFQHFGFRPDQYRGRTVVDVGAGSMLRSRFFEEARLVAIEPLADRFRAEIGGCDLD